MDDERLHIKDFGLQYKGELVTDIEVEHSSDEIRDWGGSVILSYPARTDYYVTTLRHGSYWPEEVRHRVTEAAWMELIDEVYKIQQERRRQREQETMEEQATIIKRPSKEKALTIAKAFDIPPEMLGVDSPRVISRKKTLGELA